MKLIKIGNYYMPSKTRIGDRIITTSSSVKAKEVIKILAFNGKEPELIDIPKGVF